MDRRRAGALLAAAMGSPWPRTVIAQALPADDAAALLRRQLTVPASGLVAAEVQGRQLRYAAAAQPGATVLDERTPFEIGSISKTFTALLLADAVVRGALRLDDAVETVLPERLPLRDNAGRPLRWRDLATHRSGLPRLAGNMAPADPADPYAGHGWAQQAQALRQWTPQRARDEAFEYSNLGFGLLGQALAFQAGLDYPTLLRRRVLEPLGLQDMQLSMTGWKSPVAGHDEQGRPVPAWHFTDATAGAGAIVSDARSLARYAQAALGVFDHPLREAFALCLRRHADGPAPINPVGLAWMLAPLNGRTLFLHDGATFGCAASLWLDPQRQRAALVLANAPMTVNPVALHLLDGSVPAPDPHAVQALTAQPAAPVQAAELTPLAGVYGLGPQFRLTVRADGRRLFAQATGQEAFELFRQAGSSRRRFFARVAALEIEFEGEAGAAPTLLLFQGGQTLRFVRE